MSALPAANVSLPAQPDTVRLNLVCGNGLATGVSAGTGPGGEQSGMTRGELQLKDRSVYLVGIGGCGMSGLARLMLARGAQVSGSDMYASPFTDSLASEGVKVGFDQARAWLPDACNLVVHSAAIKTDHPQVAEAARRGIPTLSYAQALGACMEGTTGVAIAGTHGKSTTTAMLGVALADAGLDPSVIVGATCPQLGGNFRLGATTLPKGSLRGQPGLLLAEACEFNRSFHNYRPRVAAITAVEADHLDIYGSLDAVVEAFREFARLIPPAAAGGLLLIADKGAHRREVTAGIECEVQTIGFSPAADWAVQWEMSTRHTALIRKGHGLVAAWMTPLPGEHNAMNAATACALATLVGADPDRIAASLGQFRGLERRTQYLGERLVRGGGVVRVYDDYGHHPTEVETTLRALRDFEKPEQHGGRLICVFQPHQHSRTRHLLEEFASAFAAADLVIVPDIYFVRDSIAEKHLVSATDLVDRLRAKGVHAMHLYPFDAIVEQLGIVCRAGDLLVVMGAGPVDKVAKGFMKSGT
ncbi:MAG: UDP-N-acetylmuramate--L-alanine ligase [Phycisphaerales bacterium]|nr:UDP-N-acetylmuramate--L-alanine ligase [Phycisphaerales bacterium]